jgi:hypothetical protein
MGLFGGSFSSSNSGSGDRVARGGQVRGTRGRGASPVSDTSYIGRRGKPLTDRQIKDYVRKGELTQARGRALLRANAQAAKNAARNARDNADDLRNA